MTRGTMQGISWFKKRLVNISLPMFSIFLKSKSSLTNTFSLAVAEHFRMQGAATWEGLLVLVIWDAKRYPVWSADKKSVRNEKICSHTSHHISGASRLVFHQYQHEDSP